MTVEELRQAVERNLDDSHVQGYEVRVQPDPFRGWRVAVISDSFADMASDERRRLVLTGLPADEIQWFDALTRDELELEGDSFLDTPLDNVPLWPQSLARGQAGTPEDIILPSDLDEFLEPPIVTTFFSLRGGVGRSTALAYAAQALAGQGHSVLCLDMDLEAPGLAALFGCESDVRQDQGIVPLLLQLDMGENVDTTSHLIQVSDTLPLYLLPAGLPSADYARQLSLLDPSAWYREQPNPLHQLLEGIKDLRIQPQVVLIDSRTGISPLSAPLLFDVCDIAVITFFPHPQTALGTGALSRALLSSHSLRKTSVGPFTPELRFLVSPVPGGRAPEIRRKYEERAAEWIASWVEDATAARRRHGRSPIDVDEILHVVGYQEEIAASDVVDANDGLSGSFEPVASWIAGFVSTAPEDLFEEEQDTLPEGKEGVLAGLKFSTGTAEAQDEEEFLQSFVRTDVVGKALDPGHPLVLGRKGTGKTAIFRKLTQDAEAHNVVMLSPPRLPSRRRWMPDAEAFATIDDARRANDLEWRLVWILHIGLACCLQMRERGVEIPVWPGGELSSTTGDPNLVTGSKFVGDLRRMMATPDVRLVAWEWLVAIDSSMSANTLLLFDGLDTGFGSSRNELSRRSEAIGGLLSLLITRGDELTSLRFKVLLREDIFRSVVVPNKSHFFGREVQLAWESQVDYLKVAVKQALRSDQFRTLTQDQVPDLSRLRQRDLFDIELWPDRLVYRVWQVLVGERVSGGKTAFTYNWVWNRLSDGNGAHGPRSLLQLFHIAVERERSFNRSSPYARSLLRPRALVESLDEVSQQALEALGREVGLLGVDTGGREDVEKYRVPELYRRALGMGRRGQA